MVDLLELVFLDFRCGTSTAIGTKSASIVGVIAVKLNVVEKGFIVHLFKDGIFKLKE